MAFLSEAAVEQALLEQLGGLGYNIEREEDIGPDGHRPERESHDEVVLKKRFEDTVARLNPGLPLEARQDAVRRVMQSELPSLLEENRRLHKLMTEGVDVAELRDTLLPKLISGERRVPDAERFVGLAAA
jgi:type I restriction enzyme, R subunit